jgi:hypothetical protein
VFHPRVVGVARAELAQSRGLQALLARVRCRVLKADAREVSCLRSFNTPPEYAELLEASGEVVARDAVPHD